MSLDITPLVAAGRKLITSYGDGRFRFGDEVHDGSVLVFADQVLPWPITDVAAIDLDALAAVTARAHEVDLLLLGLGGRLRPISATLRAGLKHYGVVAEPMDTGAACRTYNILLAEERRVAAALIAV